MTFLKKVSIIAALLVALHVPGGECNIYTINDERVRNLDITPVLGRGYSIMTNSYHSTCLMVDETTVPSFNYDYSYTDLTDTTNSYERLQVGAGRSMGFESAEQAIRDTEKRTIFSDMKVERYYSSVREEVSPLSADAKTLLSIQDYVGFFKACGPNYVRGIRRVQEVITIVQFESSSTETSKEFAMEIQTSSGFFSRSQTNSTVEQKSKFKQVSSSLTIQIDGYGLGLSQEGSETLVATTIKEYDQVMRFAFKTMTQIKGDSIHVGMVYGMEVASWVNNLAYQTESKLGDENIILPMPRSLIPRAYPRLQADLISGLAFANTAAVREKFRCKTNEFVIDKYGYCCEIEQLYDIVNEEYRTPELFDVTADVCRPLRTLDPNMIRDNLSNNGEFVARLDGAIRYKMTTMGTLERCISAANSIPDKYLDYVLKPMDTVKYDRVISYDVTLRELRLGIDPMGDYTTLKHMAQELDEWVEMFYSPCYAAMYGANIGTTPDVDVSYFMAYPWYSHEECMKLSCITNNMRWDRVNGGCIQGMMNGTELRAYSAAATETKCAKDGDQMLGATETCKYTSAAMTGFITRILNCWENLQFGQTDYLLNNYCMPEITPQEIPATDSVLSEIIASYDACRAT